MVEGGCFLHLFFFFFESDINITAQTSVERTGTYGWVGVQFHLFLSSALDVGQRTRHSPATSSRGINSGTHLVGGCLGPRADLVMLLHASHAAPPPLFQVH